MSTVLDRPGIDTAKDARTDGGGGSGYGGWVVTVFNNDENTLDEVMNVLMSATGCNQEEAAIETSEIHFQGKSVVHLAGQEECERVGAEIATIGIKVEVTPDPLYA